METGYPQAAVTLVALGDGMASLYFSTGGGVMGDSARASVSAAAKHLIEVAANHAPAFTRATEFPLPETGAVLFYVLTATGVVSSGADEGLLGQGTHPLSELFFAAHHVITQLRESTED